MKTWKQRYKALNKEFHAQGLWRAKAHNLAEAYAKLVAMVTALEDGETDAANTYYREWKELYAED